MYMGHSFRQNWQNTNNKWLQYHNCDIPGHITFAGTKLLLSMPFISSLLNDCYRCFDALCMRITVLEIDNLFN